MELRKEKSESLARRLAILRHYSTIEPRVPSTAAVERLTELGEELAGHVLRLHAEWSEDIRSLLQEGGDRESTRSALTDAVGFDKDWRRLADAVQGHLGFLSGHPRCDQLSADISRAAAEMAEQTHEAEEALIRLRASWTPNDPDRLAAGLAEARAGKGLTGDEMIAAIRARRT